MKDINHIKAGFVAINGHVFTDREARLYIRSIKYSRLVLRLRGAGSLEYSQALNSQNLTYKVCAGIL